MAFTTVHGQHVRLYGRGLYRYDTLLIGSGFKGVDAVTLLVALPLLIVSLVLYRRGSIRGGLLFTGTLAYFLYNYASMALGAVFNELFVIYVINFSASLFAFILAFASFDLRMLPSHCSEHLPRKTIATYLCALGLFLPGAWLGDVITSLARAQVPRALGSYTTMVTYVLDLGVIVPVVLLAAILLVRRTAMGLLLASTILTVNLTIGTALIAQAAAIMIDGVLLTTGEIVGLIVASGLLSVIGMCFAVVLLRNVSDEPLNTGGRLTA